MAQHFTQWVWAGWSRQALEPASASAVAAHLAADCAGCREESSFWTQLGSTLRADREELPAGLVARAVALAGSRPVARPEGTSHVRQVFDNFTAPLPALVRGLQARRHCVYELDGEPGARASVEIMAERVSRHEGWSVVGQVLTASGDGVRDCAIELQGAGATTRKRTNGFGEFGFVTAGDGPYRLDLQVGQRRFGIAPLLLP